MTDILFPNVEPSQSPQWSLVSNTGQYVSPLTGATQSYDRSGERWRVRLQFNNLTETNRALLQQFISAMNGQANRAVLRDHSYTPRGSISLSELHPALATANYSLTATGTASNIADGIRVKREGDSTSGPILRPTSQPTVSAGISYALRNSIRAPSQLQARGRSIYISPAGTDDGSLVLSAVADHATGVYVQGFTAVDSGVRAGVSDQSPSSAYSQFDVIGSSLSRALLVDNGINELTYSEQFDNAAWTKTRTTISADAAGAPDGATTADEIVEDTSNNTHFVTQSHTRTSAQEYWTFSVYLKNNGRPNVRIEVDDGAGNGGFAIFNLSTATLTSDGVLGTGENEYASAQLYPNSWVRCRITARLPSTTTARAYIYMMDNGGNLSYTGDGSSSVRAWGAQLQQGGQIGRYVATTSAAATEASQTGSEIWLKGLDEDTDGQLVAGDQIEIDGQLVMLTSDLDGDESGVGLATVIPRIRSAPADETAAVIYRPHGRFLLTNVDNGWSSQPGQNILSSLSLEFIEDIVG